MLRPIQLPRRGALVRTCALVLTALVALTSAVPAPAIEPIVTEFFRGEPLDPYEGQTGYTLSPDGKRFIFMRTNHPNLVSVNVDDPSDWGYLSRLGLTADIDYRIFSPDGRFLSYESPQVDNNGKTYYALCLVPTDGSQPPRKVVDGVELTFTGGIASVFTPDSKWLITRVDDARSLVAIPTDRDTPLVNLFGPVEDTNWSLRSVTPDSRFVVFTVGQKLYTVSLESRQPTVINDGVSSFQLTPDGKNIIYRKGNTLWSTPLRAFSQSNALTPDAGQAPDAPITFAISPDSTLLCTSVNGGIYVGSVNGILRPSKITASSASNQSIQWTPDGKYLLYYDSSNRPSIIKADGMSAPRLLPTTTSFPKISASGRWMLYQQAKKVIVAPVAEDSREIPYVLMTGLLSDLKLVTNRDIAYYVSDGILFTQDLDRADDPVALLTGLNVSKDWYSIRRDQLGFVAFRAATQALCSSSLDQGFQHCATMQITGDAVPVSIRGLFADEKQMLIATQLPAPAQPYQTAKLYSVGLQTPRGITLLTDDFSGVVGYHPDYRSSIYYSTLSAYSQNSPSISSYWWFTAGDSEASSIGCGTQSIEAPPIQLTRDGGVYTIRTQTTTYCYLDYGEYRTYGCDPYTIYGCTCYTQSYGYVCCDDLRNASSTPWMRFANYDFHAPKLHSIALKDKSVLEWNGSSGPRFAILQPSLTYLLPVSGSHIGYEPSSNNFLYSASDRETVCSLLGSQTNGDTTLILRSRRPGETQASLVVPPIKTEDYKGAWLSERLGRLLIASNGLYSATPTTGESVGVYEASPLWLEPAPDGRHAVFTAGIIGDSSLQTLHSVRFDGKAWANALGLVSPETGTWPAGKKPFLTADGQRVVYLARENGRDQLYTALLDGSIPPVRISVPSDDTAMVTHFALNKAQNLVSYRELVDEVPTIYCVAIDGGTPIARSMPEQFNIDAGQWAGETLYFAGADSALAGITTDSVVCASELLGRVPRFVAQPGTLAAQVAGTGVGLAARASGDGALRYQWEYCAAGDGVVYVPVTDGPEISGAERPALALRNVGQRHAGLYRCRATSALGMAYSRAVSLVVVGDSEPLGEEGEGAVEGEGVVEGEPEGIVEGAGEGEGEREGEGASEGEGEGEGVPTRVHSADVNRDGALQLEEVLSVVQLYSAGGLHCAEAPGATEDGYEPGAGVVDGCVPHDADNSPQDWKIGLVELLRVVQLYQLGTYHACGEEVTEDGFCVGAV